VKFFSTRPPRAVVDLLLVHRTIEMRVQPLQLTELLLANRALIGIPVPGRICSVSLDVGVIVVPDETLGDYVVCVVLAYNPRDILAGNARPAGVGLEVCCEVACDGKLPGAERALHVQALVDTRLHMRAELTFTDEGAITIITDPLRCPVINIIHVLIAGTLTAEGTGARVAFVGLAMQGAVVQVLVEAGNGCKVALTILTVCHVCG